MYLKQNWDLFITLILEAKIRYHNFPLCFILNYGFLTWVLMAGDVCWVICYFLTLPNSCDWVMDYVTFVYILHPWITINSNESCFLLILLISLTEFIGCVFIFTYTQTWFGVTIYLSSYENHFQCFCNKRGIFPILPLMYIELHITIEIIFYFSLNKNNTFVRWTHTSMVTYRNKGLVKYLTKKTNMHGFLPCFHRKSQVSRHITE